ncbi:PAS domain S-box protein [Halosimplex sp. TS25]|uniref:PAS domain S-box protein n=1 Tax=Halosimplex rarum TaxID=3396619 RepID=UPI0039ED2777
MCRRADASGAVFWGEADDSEARERYRALVNALDGGLVRIDIEGRVGGVDDVFVDLAGREREELLGRPIAALFDDGDAAAIEREIDRLSADAAERGARLALALRTADGDRVPCEMRVNALDPEGAADGFVGVVRREGGREGAERVDSDGGSVGRRSVDERERDDGNAGGDRERAIDHDHLVAALEAARGGISLLDGEGEFVYVNDAYAETFGYDPDEMIGQSWESLGIEADPAGFREEVLSTIHEDGQWAGTTTCVRSDGTRFRSHHSLVSTGDGALICFVRDVSDRTERERELRETERRFEAVFEDPNILVGLLEPDGTVVDINETAMEYIDADLADVRGDLFWETPWWGEGDDVGGEVREWTERAAAGEYVDFQADLTRPDGDRYVLEGYFRPVTDDDGDVVSIIVSDRDVTERAERERQLEESERRYRTLAEYFPNGLVTLFDRDLEYTLAAGQGFERIPVSPSEVEGKHFSEAWDEATAEALEPLFEGALDGEERSVELEYAGRDWVVHGVPITDQRGDVFAGMTMAQDITERKEREQYLHDAKSQLEAAAEAGAVGTWEWHIPEDSLVADASFARTFGIDPEEAREGVSIDRFVSSIYEADRERVEREIEAAVDSCGEYEAEYRVWNADDELRWVVARGHVECDEAGEPVNFPGALTDITERKEQQREIERSERRYRTLVENFPDGSVGLFNEDLEYTVVGGQLLDALDLSPEDRTGRSIDEIHSGELLEDIEPHFRAALEGKRASFEVEFRGRHLYANTLPVRDADDEVFAGMLVVQDVTERREAQRELRESEAKFRMLAENLEEVVWMATEDAQEFVYLNPAFEEVWGIDREELYDEPLSFLDTVHPDDRDRVREEFTALPERDFDEEFRIRRSDGEVRWVRAKGASVRDADSGMERVVGIGEDVTEQVERERRLEESERRYRTLAENFPNGAVAVYDDDLRFTLVQGAELGDVLPNRDELEGRAVTDVFPPDIVEDLEPLLGAAVEDGESGSDTFEFGGRHWRTRATPLRDADGEIFAGLSFSQDITDQVEREAELERALDLLERTERIADVGGWEIDPGTEEVFWTDHLFDLLEVDADEEPPLDDALDVYHEDDRPVVERAVAEALDSGDRFDVEGRFETPGGEMRWLRVQGVSERDDGVVTSLRGAAQDVTERKRREQRLEDLIDRLEESNERLEQFAYAASHDLQEPLRMVSSYLQLIEQRYADDLDADGREFIEFAVDGADRMRDMIDGLLQYSRVDTRGDPFEPVDLEAVFADVRDDLQVRIEESDAEITADGLPRVEGDGGQLRQVFQNLFDNAIEYSGDESPRIHVSAERVGDRWSISVRDEGIGIDADDVDRVFEVFQRLHSHDDHSGTGIGLALCERIVERHGGDIWVETEPGEGSTFTFTLPAVGGHSARL